jgi:hypothetical protein
LIEPAIWRHAGDNAAVGAVTGFEEHFQENPAKPLQADQFSIDYKTNQITLGEPLVSGMKLEVTLPIVEFDKVQPADGECVANFDPAELSGETMKFKRNGTIADVLETAIAARPDGWFLTATTSERMVEFRLQGASPTNSIIDRRLAKATSQPVAAASFGPIQATLQDWDNKPREQVLKTLLNLRPTGDRKGCLQMLRKADNMEFAYMVAAARHSAEASLYKAPACKTGACDQEDWARRWASIFYTYNKNGGHYQPKASMNGVNEIVAEGLERFFARPGFTW